MAARTYPHKDYAPLMVLGAAAIVLGILILLAPGVVGLAVAVALGVPLIIGGVIIVSGAERPKSGAA